MDGLLTACTSYIFTFQMSKEKVHLVLQPRQRVKPAQQPQGPEKYSSTESDPYRQTLNRRRRKRLHFNIVSARLHCPENIFAMTRAYGIGFHVPALISKYIYFSDKVCQSRPMNEAASQSVSGVARLLRLVAVAEAHVVALGVDDDGAVNNLGIYYGN